MLKAQVMDSVVHENDSKTDVAMRSMRQQLYGADSLYARRPSISGVSSIQETSVRDWLRAHQRAPCKTLPILHLCYPH